MQGTNIALRENLVKKPAKQELNSACVKSFYLGSLAERMRNAKEEHKLQNDEE